MEKDVKIIQLERVNQKVLTWMNTHNMPLLVPLLDNSVRKSSYFKMHSFHPEKKTMTGLVSSLSSCTCDGGVNAL